MTVLIVQSRLTSTRLDKKALLPLDSRPVLSWVLSAMKLVSADRYFLATDDVSAESLFPIAQECGFECFAGPQDDVLERFCQLIRQTGADTVIRATGDNPFLFYEAATALVAEYEKYNCDYITWTGLPHGSGVEMFNAHSLLQAALQTDDPYDHEHVGPALYNHHESFRSITLAAPSEWSFPSLRTTIDTLEDYKRSRRMVHFLLQKRRTEKNKPFSCAEIVESCAAVSNPVLFVPSTVKGRGTGHLRRCVSLAAQLVADVYIPPESDLPGIEGLLEPLEKWQITDSLPQPNEYSLIVSDYYVLSHAFAQQLSALAPLVSIDEGAPFSEYCDYLLDIIPVKELHRKPNLRKSSFIPLPKNRRESPKKIEKVLVCIGGEDPAGLTVTAAIILCGLGFSVTAVVQEPKKNEHLAGIRFIKPIENLREKLYQYDLVVTHYGFTAFESVAAGCAVLLLGTSAVHVRLAHHLKFAVLEPQDLNENSVRRLLKKTEKLFSRSPELSAMRQPLTETLADYVRKLAAGHRFLCPVCKNVHNPVFERYQNKTIRKCTDCGIIYTGWLLNPEKIYNESYFFEEYRLQYGKTYLEDFTSIKLAGTRRCTVIDSLFWKKKAQKRRSADSPSLLDIGCAYGPFLSAAADAGWQVFGTDVSEEAVTYVREQLKLPAARSQFPCFDPEQLFNVPQFDLITMWFVIEHFQDVDAVLKKVSSLLPSGGLFAFATPSGSGVSARFRHTKFFQNNPVDHFTVWQPEKTVAILDRYGFKVLKIVSTGQHPERFPLFRKRRLRPQSFWYKAVSVLSKWFSLGDTFEVYCEKLPQNQERT